jgi:1-acyl-sn-glycerol-3-phosphate acyltransferase
VRAKPNIDRSLSSRIWYGIFKCAIRTAATFVYRVRYTGIGNIPPAGPLVVVSNHQSHLDPPLLGVGFPWRLNYFARKSLFVSPLFGWFMASFDAIPVDREKSPLSGMRETLRRLKRGEALLMFPEGSRSWDGEIGPMMGGFALLAMRSKAAVLPAAIEGAFRAWPRWNRLPRLGTIHVHFGHPIPAEQVTSMTEQRLLSETASRIRQCHAILRARPVFARGK